MSKSLLFEVADALSTLSIEELAAVATPLGFSRDELEARVRRSPRRQLVVGLLLEFLERTPCHVERRLGQVLLNNGHWREALKIYPKGLSRHNMFRFPRGKKFFFEIFNLLI